MEGSKREKALCEELDSVKTKLKTMTRKKKVGSNLSQCLETSQTEKDLREKLQSAETELKDVTKEKQN